MTRRRMVYGVLSLVLLVFISFSLAWTSQESGTRSQEDHGSIAAYINEEPVWVQELQLGLEKHKTQVFRQHTLQAGMEYNEHFWDTPLEGVTPLQELRQRGLESVKQTRAQLHLMKKSGFIRSMLYPDLLHDMEQTNQERKAAIEAGNPGYGPSQYTFPIYLDYLISSSIPKMIDQPDRWTVQPTEEQLTQFILDKNRDIPRQQALRDYYQEQYRIYVTSAVKQAKVVFKESVYSLVTYE